MATLRRTAGILWEKTLRPGLVRADSIRQLRLRVGDVLSVHPQFDLARRTIGPRVVPSLKESLDQAEAVEKTLAAPFSVLLHGDYNSNNILYDAAEDRIHYIDLHRSADADLVQDVSVYMRPASSDALVPSTSLRVAQEKRSAPAGVKVSAAFPASSLVNRRISPSISERSASANWTMEQIERTLSEQRLREGNVLFNVFFCKLW